MFASRCKTIHCVLLTISLLLAACESPTASPTPEPQLPTDSDSVWHVVVIGDSSLWGLAKAFAVQIEKDVAVKVVSQSFALGELSAGSVLQVLQTGKSRNARLAKLPAALREAEVVLMFVNPLDSINPEQPLDMEGCFGFKEPESCSPEAFEKYGADLHAIWTEILELRAGQPTVLRATDIYNPLIRRWQKYDQFDLCTECWDNMSNAARMAAEAHDVPFLSRYDAFNGADHKQDPRQMGYITSDGEHPSDLASQYTAELLSKMGYAPVSEP